MGDLAPYHRNAPGRVTIGAFIMALPMIVAVFGAIAVVGLLNSPVLTHGLEAVVQRLRDLSREAQSVRKGTSTG